MLDDNTNNLIDITTNRYPVFDKSTNIPINFGGTIMLQNHLYMDCGILKFSQNDNRRCMMFSIYSFDREHTLYETSIRIPINKNNIDNEMYKSVSRLLIRRSQQLIQKLMFKRLKLFKATNFYHNDYIQHKYVITATDDGETFKPIEYDLVPCLAFMLNEDKYLKETARVNINVDCSIDGQDISIHIDINSVDNHRQNIDDMVNTYNVVIYEEEEMN